MSFIVPLYLIWVLYYYYVVMKKRAIYIIHYAS